MTSTPTDYPGQQRVEAKAAPIVAALEADGFADHARGLRELVDAARRPERRSEALEAIQSRCHPRWLGDLYVRSYEWPEWWNVVGGLGEAARRAAKRQRDTEVG